MKCCCSEVDVNIMEGKMLLRPGFAATISDPECEVLAVVELEIAKPTWGDLLRKV